MMRGSIESDYDLSIQSQFFPARLHRLQRQRGVSLFIVLISLVILSLSAVALIRSIDTGALVVGNVAFKQAATAAADASVENAVAWIQANNAGSTLYSDIANNGYYASSLDALDISGNQTAATRVLVDWDNDNCAYASSGSYASCKKASAGLTNNGLTTNYVITRTCKTAGDPNLTTNSCGKPISSGTNSSPKRGEVKYGEDKRFSPSGTPYFRVVVRARGMKNTTSYTETYVHF